MDIHEVAEMLKLSVGTVYHLVSQKRIAHLHLSKRCLRFRRGSIRAWINALGETLAKNK
jgi:excisionase family DNA binding protein